METNQTQEQSAPESTETTQVTAEVTKETGNTTPEQGNETPEVPQYTPNFKYKSIDKEYEFPEYVRGVIKDENTEKELRSVFEKAMGMDFYKNQRETLRNEYKTYREQYDPIVDDIKKCAEFVKKGDLDQFLNIWGIDDNTILQHAANKVKYYQMDEASRKQIDQQRHTSQEAYNLQQENARLQQTMQQLQVQQLDMQLSSALSRPEISEAAQFYDAQANRPGAFREDVIQWGDFLYTKTGKILPPDQVAQSLLQYRGYSPQVTTGMSAAAATTQAPTQKPVIPNVSSARGASVVKQRPSTVEDLRKMASAMSAD